MTVADVKNKDCNIKVRVDRGERDRLKSVCAALGCGMSEYVRAALIAYTVALGEKGEPPTRVVVSDAKMRALLGQARMAGVNINQVAHALNAAAKALREADEDGNVPLEEVRYAVDCIEEAADAMPGLVEQVGRVQLKVNGIAEGRVLWMPDCPGLRKAHAGEPSAA